MPRVSEILEFLEAADASFSGGATPETELRRPASLGDAAEGDLSFCGSTAVEPEAMLAATRATMVLVERALGGALSGAGRRVPVLVPVPNARLAFVRVVQRFFTPPRPAGIIHPTAVVSPSARVHPSAAVGPLCTVGDDVEIGAGTVLFAGVHVYRGVRIGAGVTIHSGTVLGADGFGFERDEKGELVKFPHVGGVVIEDGVEIGANSCVDRGSLGDTRVCARARVDNLVHIGHNAQVASDVALTAHALVGGSTRIGERAWIGPGALLMDRIEVGADVVVGLGAVVVRGVPEGTTVMGNPARTPAEHRAQKEALRRAAAETR